MSENLKPLLSIESEVPPLFWINGRDLWNSGDGKNLLPSCLVFLELCVLELSECCCVWRCVLGPRATGTLLQYPGHVACRLPHQFSVWPSRRRRHCVHAGRSVCINGFNSNSHSHYCHLWPGSRQHPKLKRQRWVFFKLVIWGQQCLNSTVKIHEQYFLRVS